MHSILKKTSKPHQFEISCIRPHQQFIDMSHFCEFQIFSQIVCTIWNHSFSSCVSNDYCLWVRKRYLSQNVFKFLKNYRALAMKYLQKLNRTFRRSILISLFWILMIARPLNRFSFTKRYCDCDSDNVF